MGRSARERLLSVPGWRVAFLVLCTVGVCLSADLARLHLRVHTDPDYHSYCAISQYVDCESVAHNAHSVFLDLPVAVWGLLGYLLLGALAIWGMRSRIPVPSWPFGLLFWLGLFCSAVGVALFLVSVLLIRAACIVCMGTYLVNFALAVVAAAEARRTGGGIVPATRAELGAASRVIRGLAMLAGGFLVILAVVWLAVPRYWKIEHASGPGGLPVGRTAEGHHWIGSPGPTLEIIEFSDYQCPFCLKAHVELRSLIEANPDRVRLVHRHFPLDQACNDRLNRPFHPFACRYAAMAYCAGEQKEFWKASDYLYEEGRRPDPVTVEEIAGAVGLDRAKLAACLESERPGRMVAADLAEGQAHGIRGTPTFLVGGEAYPGRIPDEVIRRALGPAAGPAGAPAAQGLPDPR